MLGPARSTEDSVAVVISRHRHGRVAVAHRAFNSLLFFTSGYPAPLAARSRTLASRAGGVATADLPRRASHAACCHFGDGLLQAFRRDGLRQDGDRRSAVQRLVWTEGRGENEPRCEMGRSGGCRASAAGGCSAQSLIHDARPAPIPLPLPCCGSQVVNARLGTISTPGRSRKASSSGRRLS